MGVLKGDFIGFTIGNYHSSDLGIIRTSDGSRFNENLLPNFSDKTVKVPGRDETLYFRTEYDKKEFPISFAFDSLTEEQLRLLKKVFGKKELQDLIFDEAPYKVYKVKVASAPNLKYICFEENSERIYKGEGSVTFVAYFPFAKSRFKYKENYNYHSIPEWKYTIDNKDEWIAASGIKSLKELTNYSNIPADKFECVQLGYLSGLTSVTQGNGIDLVTEASFYDDTANNIFGTFRTRLYNPGDLETNFELKINAQSTTAWQNLTEGSELSFSIKLFLNDEEKMYIKDLTLSYDNLLERGFIINGYNQLIEGIEGGLEERNGKIYNKNIISGDFFKIPPSSSVANAPILKIVMSVSIKNSLFDLKKDFYLFPSLPTISINDVEIVDKGYYNTNINYDYLYY